MGPTSACAALANAVPEVTRGRLRRAPPAPECPPHPGCRYGEASAASAGASWVRRNRHGPAPAAQGCGPARLMHVGGVGGVKICPASPRLKRAARTGAEGGRPELRGHLQKSAKKRGRWRGAVAGARGSGAPALWMSRVMLVTHSHCLYLAVTQLSLL